MNKIEQEMVAAAARKLQEARDAAKKRSDQAKAGGASTAESSLHDGSARLWGQLAKDFDSVLGKS